MALRVVDEHRGYDIVETDYWVKDGRKLLPVYIVPGMRAFSEPALTSVEEAKRAIDDELASEEEVEDLMTEEFLVKLKPRGGSLDAVIPAKSVKRLGLVANDEVLMKMKRAQHRRRPPKTFLSP